MGTPMVTTTDAALAAGCGDRAGGFPKRLSAMLGAVRGRITLLDARIRTMMAEPERGAATAEYAVVLVAATGFAGLLVALLKSDAVRGLLTNIVRQALNT